MVALELELSVLICRARSKCIASSISRLIDRDNYNI